MFYFKHFENIPYETFQGEITAKNITRRYITVKNLINEHDSIIYDYRIKEGERPDIIAEKYYKDSRLDWIIFIVNKIVDPVFGWPLSRMEMIDFLKKKYGSVENSKRETFAYYQIENGLNIRIDEKKYNTLEVKKRKEETFYDMEIRLNEEKRNIKLIDKRFVPQILSEIKELYG